MPRGKYLYCIIRCAGEPAFDGVAAIGERGSRIHTISWRGLGAVVSDSMASEYPVDRVAMLAHQRVLEHVMQRYTLLPVRFGTVAESDDPAVSVQRLLQKRYSEFDGLLAEMDRKVELGLKALWRRQDAVFEEIVAENQEIRRLRDRLNGHSSHGGHDQRIRLGELVQQALQRKKAAEGARILAPLRAIAERVVEEPAVLDRLIVNAAFLVGRECEADFDRMVAVLDDELQSRVVLKYVGPVPPYNFVHVVVNWEEVLNDHGDSLITPDAADIGGAAARAPSRNFAQ